MANEVTCITKHCQTYYLDVLEYVEALHLQERLVKARQSGDIPNTILFLQHPPVITIGVSSREDDIVVPRNVLAAEGVATVYSDRGGGVTVHEPGQLVGYPILDLSTKDRDLHRYVWNLEETIIRTLGDYSIPTHRVPDQPGVWVEGIKICALGIRVSRWVTKHGFALNINNDLKYFSYVHPCGITNKGVTSMSRLLGHKVDIGDVMLRIIDHFSQVFEFTIKQESVDDLSSVQCLHQRHG